ncbi:hypothetical protein CI109_101031 [Kwoniella shandongensis]|uniref:U6 snRNA phosphodiesterase 1 n=1 Tax=Kwoniella shandongensis TaxID=1734106 RepID=A0AAJ8LCP9_9TREE
MALVDYDSSSSSSSCEDEKHSGATSSIVDAGKRIAPLKSQSPAKRQRKLPSLPSTFDTTPKDDPSLHQGRKRSRPFVDGEYNAHVYLSLPIPASLRNTLTSLLSTLSTLSTLLPSHTIHPLLPSLHISLTHSLPLRRHQIAPFRDQLRAALTSPRSRAGPFKLSFVGGVKGYDNHIAGNGGRAFLALRVGAGAVELKEIVDKAIHPLLEVVHLPRYHDNPEFHTSFAWTLIDPDSTQEKNVGNKDQEVDVEDAEAEAIATGTAEGVARANTSAVSSDTITHRSKSSPFTKSILDQLNAKYEAQILACQPRGGWDVDNVHLKIGKDITVIKLTSA